MLAVATRETRRRESQRCLHPAHPLTNRRRLRCRATVSRSADDGDRSDRRRAPPPRTARSDPRRPQRSMLPRLNGATLCDQVVCTTSTSMHARCVTRFGTDPSNPRTPLSPRSPTTRRSAWTTSATANERGGRAPGLDSGLHIDAIGAQTLSQRFDMHRLSVNRVGRQVPGEDGRRLRGRHRRDRLVVHADDMQRGSGHLGDRGCLHDGTVRRGGTIRPDDDVLIHASPQSSVSTCRGRCSPSPEPAPLRAGLPSGKVPRRAPLRASISGGKRPRRWSR